MLSIIVAKAKNNTIGKDNKLLWNIPDDLKRFKELTTNHNIIMGRKTFESIGRILPNRKHIVFSQNPDFKVNNENVEIVHSMLQIQQYIEDENERLLFDTGYSDAFIRNAQAMNIDLSAISTLILSHGHNDHTGGIKYLMNQYPDCNCKIVAHPDVFKKRIYNELHIGSPLTEKDVKKGDELTFDQAARQSK